MTTIGNDTVPGPVTEVTTADFVGIAPSAPQDVALAGPAQFGAAANEGDGTAETVYTIVSAEQAKERFGKDSMLAYNCELALGNGANPVYAVAPAETSVTGEALDGTQTGTLDNAPVSEATNDDGTAADVTITVDGAAKNTYPTHKDLADITVSSGDAYYRPDTGAYKVDAAGSDTSGTNDTADYVYYDYGPALDEVENKLAPTVDFVAALQENEAVAAQVQTRVGNLESQYNFAIGLFGAGMTVDDAAYTNPFDDSRMQGYYPTRDSKGRSIMGAIAGKRAALSINTSPLKSGVAGVTALIHRLDLAQKSNLLNENINPMDSRSSGAVIVEDLTSVLDTNADEAGMDTGFRRLVMDQVTKLVQENEEPFIGGLNTQSARAALGGVLKTQMRDLRRSEAVEDFQVNVRERDARSAEVEVNVETTAAMRNIYNTVTAGIRSFDSEQ